MQSSEPGGGEHPRDANVGLRHIRCFCGDYYWDPYSLATVRSAMRA